MVLGGIASSWQHQVTPRTHNIMLSTWQHVGERLMLLHGMDRGPGARGDPLRRFLRIHASDHTALAFDPYLNLARMVHRHTSLADLLAFDSSMKRALTPCLDNRSTCVLKVHSCNRNHVTSGHGLANKNKHRQQRRQLFVAAKALLCLEQFLPTRSMLLLSSKCTPEQLFRTQVLQSAAQ